MAKLLEITYGQWLCMNVQVPSMVVGTHARLQNEEIRAVIEE